MEKKMIRPIEVEYDFKVGNEYIRKVYTCTTYEDWHSVVRLLYECKDDYKVISVRHIQEDEVEDEV